MTHQSTKTHLLTKARPSMTGCLKAAIVAAPFILAAPSEAAVTVRSVTTGFTGQFAPANWARTSNVNGSRSEFVNSNTAIRLTKSAGNTPTASATRVLDSALFDALKPVGAGPLVGFTYKYDWSWSFTATATNPANKATNSSWVFQSIPTATLFNTSAPLSGLFTSGSPDAILGASLASVAPFRQGSGIGTISNFEFVAEYEVPGPLPILGAGAAFAWSRKLRRRLKVSNELA